MTLPIQTPAIDRANRAMGLHAAAAPPGMAQQKIDLGDLVGIGCEACSFLPFPISIACKFVCATAAQRL